MKIISESIDKTGEFAKSPAFKDYKYVLDEVNRLKANSSDSTDDDETYTDDFFANAEMVIRYGNFRKLGKGSSRTAYSFDADPRYVLKFSHNANGLKQSRTEIKNAKAGDYSCIVRIMEYDPDGVLIVEDRCRESTYADWLRIIGISPNMLSKIVRTVFDRRKTPKYGDYTLRDLRDDISDVRVADVVLRKTSPLDDEFLPKDHPKIMNCVDNMLAAADGKPVAAKWVALYDLIRFYCDNGIAAMIPEEILFTDQWGVKPGKTPEDKSLIIVDPGVDEDFLPFVGKNGRVK